MVRRLFKECRGERRHVDDSESMGEGINVLRRSMHICLDGLRTLWKVKIAGATPKFELESPNKSQTCYINVSHSVCVLSNERKGP